MAAGQDNPGSGGEGVETGRERARRYRYSEESLPSIATVATGGGVGSAGAQMPSAGLPSLPIEWNRIWIALAAAGLCFLALYPTELLQLKDKWYTDAGWSHGFVVPLIAIFFVRLKWDTLRLLPPKGSWIGFGVLLLGVVGQVLFRATGTTHMSNLSILVLLFGVVLFVFGWEHLKLLWLPIAYLVFALPPPGPLYVAMTTPMQGIAAELGTRMLPLFGATGIREGNVIHVLRGSLPPISLEVAQACSGMRMLVAFFALAVALAYSTNRPVWQKVFLGLCALPIAIICNGFRVTITGVLGVNWGPQWMEGSTHETVGLLMLIPAMFMQLGMGWILDRMFIEVDEPVKGVLS